MFNAPGANPFSFGQSTAPAASSASTTFGFGAPAATTAAPSFGFGQQQQQQPAAAATPTFGFGAPATTTAAPTFGFGQQPATTAAAPSFGFGQQQQQPAATTNAFGFGQPATTAAAPSFGFGQQQQQPAATTNTFGFGQPAATAAAPTFGFGQQPATTAAAPSFGFGQQQQPAATTNTFGFGQPATTAAAPSFGFGQQQQQPAATTNTFGFGAPAATAAAPSFGFGTQQPAAASTNAFGFGAPAATAAAPSFGFGTQQPAATTAQSTLGFNGFGQVQQQPAAGFGFGQNAAAANTGFGFGQNTGTANAGFGFGQNQQGMTSAFSTAGNATTASSAFGVGVGDKKATTRGVKPNKTPYEGGYLHSITGMSQFTSYSFEELRFNDYNSGQTGVPGQAGPAFGAPATTSGFSFSTTPGFGTTPASTAPGTSLFANQTSTPGFGTGGFFGNQTTNTTFGSAAPGTTNNTTGGFGFAANTGSAFGQSSAFSVAAKPATSGTNTGLFSAGSTGFQLGGAAGTPSLGFQTGATTNTTGLNQTPSLFQSATNGFTFPSAAQPPFSAAQPNSFNFAQPQAAQSNTAAPAEPQPYIKAIGNDGFDSFSYSSQNFRKIYGKKTSSTPKKSLQSSLSPSPVAKTYTLPFTPTRKDYVDDLPGLGLISTRPDYILKPSVAELEKRYNEDGKFVVDGLIIERANVGSVKFLNPVDMRNINIDKVVSIEAREISIDHSDDRHGGYKLNIPARVHLKGAIQGSSVNDASLQAAHNWCKACDATFISLDKESGFVFEVKHFSKYTIPIFDDHEAQQPGNPTANPPHQEDPMSVSRPAAQQPNPFYVHNLQTPHVQHKPQQRRSSTFDGWTDTQAANPAAVPEPQAHAFIAHEGPQQPLWDEEDEQEMKDDDDYSDEFLYLSDRKESRNVPPNLTNISFREENPAKQRTSHLATRKYYRRPLPAFEKDSPAQSESIEQEKVDDSRRFRICWDITGIWRPNFTRVDLIVPMPSNPTISSNYGTNTLTAAEKQENSDENPTISLLNKYKRLANDESHRDVWEFAITFIKISRIREASEFQERSHFRHKMIDFLETLLNYDVALTDDGSVLSIVQHFARDKSLGINKASQRNNIYLLSVLNQAGSSLNIAPMINILQRSDLRDSHDAKEIVSLLRVISGDMDSILEDFPALDWREVFALVFRYSISENDDLMLGFDTLKRLISNSACPEKFSRECLLYIELYKSICDNAYEPNLGVVENYYPVHGDSIGQSNPLFSWQLSNLFVWLQSENERSAAFLSPYIRIQSDYLDLLLREGRYIPAINLLTTVMYQSSAVTRPVFRDIIKILFGRIMRDRYVFPELINKRLSNDGTDNLASGCEIDIFNERMQFLDYKFDRLSIIILLGDRLPTTESKETRHMVTKWVRYIRQVVCDRLFFMAPSATLSTPFMTAPETLSSHVWNDRILPLTIYQKDSYDEGTAIYAGYAGGLYVQDGYEKIISDSKTVLRTSSLEEQLQSYCDEVQTAHNAYEKLLTVHREMRSFIRTHFASHIHKKMSSHHYREILRGADSPPTDADSIVTQAHKPISTH